MEKLLTVKQAAEFAQVSSKTIMRRVAEGRLKAENYGTAKRADWRIAPAALTDLKPIDAPEPLPPLPRRRRRRPISVPGNYFPLVSD